MVVPGAKHRSADGATHMSLKCSLVGLASKGSVEGSWMWSATRSDTLRVGQALFTVSNSKLGPNIDI